MHAESCQQMIGEFLRLPPPPPQDDFPVSISQGATETDVVFMFAGGGGWSGAELILGFFYF